MGRGENIDRENRGRGREKERERERAVYRDANSSGNCAGSYHSNSFDIG